MSDAGLDPGEQLIWTGTPRVLRYTAAMGRRPFLVGIFVCGFALYWMHIGALANFPFAPFGIVVLISGSAMLLSPARHLLGGLRASYALTDRRAILDLATGRISVPLAQVQYIDVRRSRDGGGDIYFQDTYVPGTESQTLRRNGFVAIDDVGKVEKLLRAAVDNVTAGRTPEMERTA